MKHIITSLSMLCLMIGCSGQNVNSVLLILDVENAIDTPRSFDLAEISEKIDFVDLNDEIRESLIGNIVSIEESKTGFYINDGTDRPVKLFDPKGKFIATRGHIGRGPNEISGIGNIAVDYETDNIYLMPWGSTTVISYDAQGGMSARNDSIPAVAISYFDNRLILIRQRHGLREIDDSESGTEGALVEIFSSDLTTREGSVDTPQRIAPRRYLEGGNIILYNEAFLSNNGKYLIVKERLCDTIFHYKNRVLVPAYVLDMGMYAIPIGVYGKNSTTIWSDNFHQIENIYEGDRYYVIKTMSGRPIYRNYLVFDRENISGGFSATNQDKQNGLFVCGIKFTPTYIRDNRLVGYMQAIDIVDNAASITNPDLKALAATLKEDSNPVIVIAKLKK